MAQQVGETAASGLRLRIISGLVLAPIALGSIWAGTPYFEGMVALAAAFMCWEWSGMQSGEQTISAKILLTAGVLAAVILSSHSQFLPAFLVILVCAFTVLLFVKPGGRIWTCSGLTYIGLPCLCLIWLRNEFSAGFIIVLGLFAIVWATDIGAYAAGRLIGGPKLAPSISPNKTWSGFAGGLVCAVVTIIVMVGAMETPIIGIWAATMLAVGLSITSQIGDLLESRIKRRQAVKDTGKLIPGHGGVLDRVDGVLLAAPMAAVLMLVYRNWWA